MTPPNKLEQLEEFQDALQSEEGLERLRAMQYLQQMNNQGLIGLPIVRGRSSPTQSTPFGMMAAKEGGPIVHQFFGGQGNTISQLIEQVKKENLLQGDNVNPEGNIVYTGTSDGSGVSATARRVPFLGGSGVAYPDPNISQAQVKQESSLTDLNADVLSRNGEGAIFSYGNQNYQASSEGPTLIHSLTQEGIRNRAIQGGLIDYAGREPVNLSPPDVRLTNPVEKEIDTGSRDYPNLIELRVEQDPNYTGPYIEKESPKGFVNQLGRPADLSNAFKQSDPNAPYGYVEYTPPFIGGGMIPSPIMVPADEFGNPIPPNTGLKRAMAGGGGYVLDLAGGGSIADTAQGLAGFGRHGDNMLVHMNPEEVEGLMSLGNITVNPVTGLPEAFSIGRIFRPIRKAVSAVTKPIRNIVKSKAFKAIAPLALAVAAPYALGALAPGVFGTGATMFGGALSTSGALGYGLATGLGSFAGNLLAGARPGDALRQGLMSGATGGLFKGLGSGNWMGTGGQPPVSIPGKVTQVGPGVKNINVAQTAGKAPVTGGNPFAAAQQAKVAEQAAQQAAEVSKIGSNILTTPGGPEGYVGGLQPTITAEGVPTNIAQNLSTPKFSNIQFTTEGVPSAPEATRESLFSSRLSPSGGSPVPGTGSIWDKTKQVGQDIYKDYGNWKGAAKLVGMDLMQPDWDQVYASEKAMEDQLTDLGYTVDTGFGGQVVIRDPAGQTLPSNLTIEEILNRALGKSPRTTLVSRYGFAPTVDTKHGGGLGSLVHRQYGDKIGTPDQLGNILYNQDKIKEVAENYEGFGGATGRVSDARHMAVGNELSKTLSPGIVPDWVGDALSMGILSSKEVIDLIKRGFTKENWEEVKEDVLANWKGTFKTPNTETIEDVYANVYEENPLIPKARGGDFSGRVEGEGHGMEDNVYMPIVDRKQQQQVGTLAVSPSEYVVDAHTMSALGNGNADQGAKVMDAVVESVRKKAYGTVRQPNEIDGLAALQPMMAGV